MLLCIQNWQQKNYIYTLPLVSPHSHKYNEKEQHKWSGEMHQFYLTHLLYLRQETYEILMSDKIFSNSIYLIVKQFSVNVHDSCLHFSTTR